MDNYFLVNLVLMKTQSLKILALINWSTVSKNSKYAPVGELIPHMGLNEKYSKLISA